MINRRHIMVAGLLALLSACSTSSNAPDADVADKALNVIGVSVDASAITEDMLGGAIALTAFEGDLEARIVPLLAEQSLESGMPVSVAITVTEVSLISILQGAVPGAKSDIKGQVAVTDQPTLAITGVSDRFRVPGVIGIVTSPNREKDYNETADGFAATIAEAVFRRSDRN